MHFYTSHMTCLSCGAHLTVLIFMLILSARTFAALPSLVCTHWLRNPTQSRGMFIFAASAVSVDCGPARHSS